MPAKKYHSFFIIDIERWFSSVVLSLYPVLESNVMTCVDLWGED